MADQDETRQLLWMFRQKAPERETGEVEFDAVDAIYLLQKNTNNPYLKRAIAPSPRKLERSPGDLSRLVSFFAGQAPYQVAPSNENRPFANRTLSHPPPPPTTRPAFQEPDRLPGDRAALPWLIHGFFTSVVSRLRAEPGEFAAVVNELLHLCGEQGIRVKIYEAHYAFEDWNHLLETLDEIAQYPSPETFDLFCSALFAYYELAFAPD